jgi:hypothetical protein
MSLGVWIDSTEALEQSWGMAVAANNSLHRRLC